MQFIYMFKVHTNPLTCTLRNRLDTDAKKSWQKGGYVVEDVLWRHFGYKKASQRRSLRCLQKRGIIHLQFPYDNAAMNNSKQFTTYHRFNLLIILSGHPWDHKNYPFRRSVSALSPAQMDATLLANSSQHCWMLQVSSFCTSCYTLLGVVPVKLLSQQLPTFLLFRDRQSIAQQHWIHLYSSSNIVSAANVHFTMVYKVFWVVSFPLCTGGPNIVGSSCIHLHTTANNICLWQGHWLSSACLQCISGGVSQYGQYGRWLLRNVWLQHVTRTKILLLLLLPQFP